jgi:methionyl-tRNA synthetase
MAKTFYVTTPIYYVNARPHLGHLYTTLVADTMTRFKRQRGVDSFFLTGTDEHGVNIERAAEARGIPVKQHVDEIVQEFKDAFSPMGIEYDRWIRTTDPFHEESVQKLWQVLYDRGYIYKGNYEGWFCAYCNEFKDVEPGDENPICPDHDRPLTRVAEESYFFKLSAMQAPLLDLYRSRPDFVRPESRLNEVVSFVAGGLKDLSVSRVSVKWGIPVPGDPAHTIYVWLDALANYITALGWGNNAYHDFDRYWPGTHLVGKDILRFHAVYWPALLLAAGIEVPRQVRAHGMWLSGGRRMSKTLGNTIDLSVLYKHFTPDMIRYFVLREMAFGQDGDFTYGALIDRVNSDLADGLGNLASRTLTMVKNYFEGKPPSHLPDSASAPVLAGAQEVRAAVEQGKHGFDAEFYEMNFSRAIEAAWAAIARIDKFITENQPWKLAKQPSGRTDLDAVLFTAYEGLRQIVLLMAPVLPTTTREIWGQMGLAGEPLKINPAESDWGALNELPRIDRVAPAFPKLPKEKIMTEIENEKAPSAEAGASQTSKADSGNASSQPAVDAEAPSGAVPSAAPATSSLTPPLADTIAIDDFVKVDLRVATVLEAERIPKADKLLKLSVDVGEGQPRQILAGIAMHYSPEQLIGRKIVVVANLAPRKLRGLESNGMLLAASVGEDGKPVLTTFAEDVPNGARLK